VGRVRWSVLRLCPGPPIIQFVGTGSDGGWGGVYVRAATRAVVQSRVGLPCVQCGLLMPFACTCARSLLTHATCPLERSPTCPAPPVQTHAHPSTPTCSLPALHNLRHLPPHARLGQGRVQLQAQHRDGPLCGGRQRRADAGAL